MRTIPLHNRQGDIRELALVDDIDYPDLNRFRWSMDGRGYVQRHGGRLNGKKTHIKMHRQVLGLTPGDGTIVDHINHTPWDNQRHNLRIGDVRLNSQNMRSHRDSTSKFRGVCYDRNRKKWMARACLKGHSYNLGRFADEYEAALAFDAFARVHMRGYVSPL